jgi:hypothetical protein
MNLLVRRLDYFAEVTLPGEIRRDIIVELHKVRLMASIARFRRTIETFYTDPETGRIFSDGPQVYRLYFFLHDISGSAEPVSYLSYRMVDSVTNLEIDINADEFYRALCPRSWLVQISELRQSPETEMEKMLTIFDQRNITENPHIISVNKNDFPKSCLSVIRRLRKASKIRDIRRAMKIEDDYMDEFRRWGETLEEQRKTIEQNNKDIRELKRQLSKMRKHGKKIQNR